MMHAYVNSAVRKHSIAFASFGFPTTPERFCLTVCDLSKVLDGRDLFNRYIAYIRHELLKEIGHLMYFIGFTGLNLHAYVTI